MFSAQSLQILGRAAVQWDRTERLLKQVEFLAGEVFDPGINELRYAGRRLVDAVTAAIRNEDDQTILAYIIEVEQFCYRAQHDCIDAVILFLSDKLEYMESTFGPKLLHEHFTEYSALRSDLFELGEIVVESRGQRGGRIKLYNDIEENRLPNTIRLVRALRSSEDILVAYAEDEAKRLKYEAKVLFWTRIGVLVAIVTGLSAVVMWYLTTN